MAKLIGAQSRHRNARRRKSSMYDSSAACCSRDSFQQLIRLKARGRRRCVLRKKCPHRLILVLEGMAGLGERVNQVAAMHLFVTHQHGIDYGDPDAAAHIAHQVVESADIADVPVGQRAHGGRSQRNEDETHGRTAEYNRPRQGPLGDSEVGPRPSESETIPPAGIFTRCPASYLGAVIFGALT